MSETIERFREMLIVCDNPEEFTESQYEEYFQVLSDVKSDLVSYIGRIMNTEPYYFKLYMPSKNVEAAQLNSNGAGGLMELVYLPFGVFSLNVWNKICKADSDNPVYRLLEVLDFDTRAIRMFLSVRDAYPDYITTEIINEYGILDIFSLHSFEHIYTDATRYFVKDDSEALSYTE
ncbi:MAG: hypothetical protein K2M91_01725 [Lachnospiraceae bacterium]|nr:hypothetical protein [Lachnospiraceae bacterium]